MFVDYVLKRIELVSQRIYVKLCKCQPIDAFVMYILQSFTWVREYYPFEFEKFYVFSQKLYPLLQVCGQSYKKNPTKNSLLK